MPPDPLDPIEALRACITQLVNEAVAKALAASPGHVTREYLSAAEAASLAGVTVATIRRWISEERLANHGVGRKIRVDRAELDALMRPGGRPRRAPAKKKREPTPDEIAASMGYQ